METKVDQQPSSMVYVQASELFPKKILSSDESLQVPFPELCGESVECQEKVPDGDLTLSNFRLFIRSKDSFVNIPLRLIESVEIRDMFIVHISCKDARSFRISFDSNEQCTEWYHHLIKGIAPVSRLEDLFAFAFHAWCLDSKPANPSEEEELSDFYQTSELPYSFMSEVRRMGFDNLQHAWRITDINSNFQLCSTYPKLHIVPAEITDKEMEAVVKFRTSGRFPSVVWRHLTNGAVIARCSQPEVGWFGWRSPEDEALLHAIGTACTMVSDALSLKKQYLRQIGEKISSKNRHLKGVPNGDVSVENVDDCDHTNERNEDQGLLRDSSSEGRKVLIVDARAYTAAVVNRAKGGGCEYEEYYPSCEVLFMNLANIHTVRKSFQSLRTLCSGPRDIPNWWSSIEKTNWLHHISLLLKAANTVVNAVDKEQRPVVIHCSDGWDRTSQIVALAELMLDPYYRTIEGFQVLVTREWLEFGHRFADRCGHGHDCDENQRCPVFLQWLDCVHQLTRQFPCSFEFNDTFLVKLAQHTFACLFGTFLCNSESERLRANILKRTCSVWSLLKPKRREFRNFLFSSTTEQVLHPSCQTRCLQLWSAVYLAYATPYSEAVIESGSTSDYGGSVSSPCNTPTSTLFESNIKGLTSNAVDSVSGFKQQCCSSASKSDGDIVICNDCQSSLLERNQHPVNLDGDLKSKSCTECSTSSSHNNVLVKPVFARDHVENKSLYLSAEGVCAGSVLPCVDSISEVESSMSSSTATVILEQSEEDSSLADKKSSSVKKLINENSPEEIQENLCSQKEKNHIILPNGIENAKEDLRSGNLSRHLFFYKEQTDCNTESAQDQVNNSSSDSTLKCDEQEVSPSVTTLKASSSHFFTRYLDLDGLTSVVDPVQERLWQIEMMHQARLESLQRQLAVAQRRQDVTGNMDPSGKGCDLADEVCSLPESSVSGDQPSLSLSSADEGSWIQVEENDTKVTLWVPDHAATNCAKCDAQFWVANRKHHCRNCGLVFCGSCSENRLPVPEEQLYDPVRVCYSCFEKLVTLQGRENGGRQNSEAAGS